MGHKILCHSQSTKQTPYINESVLHMSNYYVVTLTWWDRLLLKSYLTNVDKLNTKYINKGINECN